MVSRFVVELSQDGSLVMAHVKLSSGHCQILLINLTIRLYRYFAPNISFTVYFYHLLKGCTGPQNCTVPI